jgi:uncharacterized protein
MKKSFLIAMLASLGMVACSQQNKSKTSKPDPADNNTLLWRVSGNGLIKPSYLFGTMHMICASDLQVSDSLSKAIKNSDKVYLEVNMEDMMGMMMKLLLDPSSLTMRGDTSLQDLLTPDEYKKLKAYFEKTAGGMIPFSTLEKMKPFFLQALLMDGAGQCDNMVIVEQMVMEEAKKNEVKIDGLETIDYQLQIFDQIPYKIQAQQLVKMTEDTSKKTDDGLQLLTNAYRNQELQKLNDMTMSDESVSQYADLLLYNRNSNWVTKLRELMKGSSLVVAVGAGHLPGDKGVINLLRKAGYKVEPVKNNMIKKGKEI